jgi:hypothetical protein
MAYATIIFLRVAAFRLNRMEFRMKALLAVLLLVLLMGCASDNGKGTDPQVRFGGSMTTKIRSTHGM